VRLRAGVESIHRAAALFRLRRKSNRPDWQALPERTAPPTHTQSIPPIGPYCRLAPLSPPCGAFFCSPPRHAMTDHPRRFPPPWDVLETVACFIVKDGNGQAPAYIYYEDKPGHARPCLQPILQTAPATMRRRSCACQRSLETRSHVLCTRRPIWLEPRLARNSAPMTMSRSSAREPRQLWLRRRRSTARRIAINIAELPELLRRLIA
jgi:hypothetical protein